MRTTLTTTALFLTLLSPTALSAEVVIRPHDRAAAAQPHRSPGDEPGSAAGKIDEPAVGLYVPFYEVDTTDPAGTTTLFAVRNRTSDPIVLDVYYRAPDGTTLRHDVETLAGSATLSRNVRDVGGLPADPDGFTRGYVYVRTQTDEPDLEGDYLQVDVGNDFATGERMIRRADLCGSAEIRFLDFGAGTELRFFIANPQGADPMTDPSTMTVRVFDESGKLIDGGDVLTDQKSLELAASDFTTASFGTLLLSFHEDSAGAVYADYSAGGRFSVGLNGGCWEP